MLGREILFRGKRIATGRWVEGSLLNYGDGDYDICAESDMPGELVKYAVYPKTVSQFTGLTDKNGKKIFEGDILAKYIVDEDFFSGEKNCPQRDIAIIVWCDNAWRKIEGIIRLSDNKKKILGIADDEYLRNSDCEEYEIIGSIHDNPELLEAQYVR